MAVEPGFVAMYLADVEKPMSALEKEIYVRKDLGFDFIILQSFQKHCWGMRMMGIPSIKAHLEIYSRKHRTVSKC